jgi:hypothetical protein
MITYTWNIAQLDCAPIENGLANVIKTIHWTYTAQETDGDQLVSSCNTYYQLNSPAPEQFVDFETLTEDQVIGWLENSLNMSILQNNLANQIIAQRNPPIRPLPLPWGKIEVEEVVEPEPTLEELIDVGHNPDARDGDGDGLVQDGTEWERPIDTQP